MYLTDETNLGTIEGPGAFGTIGTQTNDSAGITGIVDLISTLIGALTIIAAIWFLFNVLFGGYEWMSAGGDSKKLGNARDHITHAFIGLVIVVAAWSLTAVAGQILGFDTINPAAVLNLLPIH